MVIGEIGNSFESTRKIDYFSNITLLDFDAIILDFNSFQNGGYFTEVHRQFTIPRIEQILDFVKHKKIPIIYFTPSPTDFIFNISGSLQTKQFDFFVPIDKISVKSEVGNRLQIVPKTKFYDFLNKYEQSFKYNSYLSDGINGVTFVETQHTRKCLGFYNKNYIILPPLKNKLGGLEKEFLNDLIITAKSIIISDSISVLPEWANKFHLPKELDLVNEIKRIETEIQSLSQLLDIKTLEIEDFAFKKRLFTATGLELENEVKKIFIDLGFEILETEDNRDDLIVKHKNRIAVIEIKGVTKSSAEKHAAQLEKWSALYIENHGVSPKAILIVNSYKDIAINNRLDPTFPDQMLGYSSKREHCLITTIQLLNLYYSVINSKSDIDTIIDSLFLTNGVYNNFEKWDEFITHSDE